MARQVDIVLTLNAAGVVTGGKAGEAGVKGIERQVKQTEKALVSMGRQGKKAGQDIGQTMRSGRRGALALNRVVQDMPFGFIAIQNNITEVAASFTTMRQNGLSGMESIKSILSQFTGPAGFLFIFSTAVALITAFGGAIVEAFSKGTSSAKELSEALDTLLKIQRDLTRFEGQAVNVEARLAVTRTLLLENTAEITKITTLAAGATSNLTQAQREELKVLFEREGAIEELQEKLEGELEVSAALALEREVLAATGFSVVKNEKEIKKAAEETTDALSDLLKIERDLKDLRIAEVDIPASIAAAEAEITRLQKVQFVIGQLTQAQTKRLEGIRSLLTQLRKEEGLTGELAFQQELVVFLGGKVVESEEDHTSAIKEQITQLEKLQVELAGLRAISIDEAVAIQTATRDLQRQITARRSLVDLLAEQAEAQALLARAGVEIEPLEPRGLEKPLVAPTKLVGTEGIDAQIEATERLIEIQRRRQEAAEAVRAAEVATAESAVLSAAASVKAGDNVLQATLGVVRDIIQARLAQAIAGAVASSSIFGPIAGAVAGALMAVLFNQLMPSGHRGSSGGAGASARADTTSNLGVGLGGIRVQNRGVTAGAQGAAASARALSVTIRVIEPDLFRLNTELSNADGIRDQVGAI